MSVSIRLLSGFDVAAFERIAAGYTSAQKYAVVKQETDANTSITLQLVDLPTPYVKVWQHDPGLLGYYRSFATRGFSVGAWDDATGEQVGIALADVQGWNGSLIIWEFHVAASHQGQQIGRRMMDRVVEAASAAGLRIVTVETHNTNVPAIRFYRKVGFEIGSLDLYFYTNDDYPDGEVAVFMKRKLP